MGLEPKRPVWSAPLVPDPRVSNCDNIQRSVAYTLFALFYIVLYCYILLYIVIYCYILLYTVIYCYIFFIYGYILLYLYTYIYLYIFIYCYILLYIVIYCFTLLHIVIYCYILLYIVVCYILFNNVIYCYILLYIVIYILLYIVIYCFILLYIVLYCCILLYMVITIYYIRSCCVVLRWFPPSGQPGIRPEIWIVLDLVGTLGTLNSTGPDERPVLCGRKSSSVQLAFRGRNLKVSQECLWKLGKTKILGYNIIY